MLTGMSAEFTSRDVVDREEGGRAGISPALIAAIVIAVLVVIFVLQNGQRAKVDFLWMDWRMPIWLVIAISLVLGALLSKLIGIFWRRRDER